MMRSSRRKGRMRKGSRKQRRCMRRRHRRRKGSLRSMRRRSVAKLLERIPKIGFSHIWKGEEDE